MKKFVLYGLLVVFIPVLIVSVIHYQDATKYPAVRTAISRNEATTLQDDETYFIVTPTSKWTTATGWMLKYQNDTGEEIYIKGKAPQNELSDVLYDSSNEFLVKGELISGVSEKNGVAFIQAESWEIIYPVRRNYDLPNAPAKTRFFYPKGYIDEFDVENQDYGIRKAR
ncbi:hypothetical protein [Isobaculum melis]|uniref:Uncharacterized protein n=1 Tax=Isobaculum melis TaxID=142588 RepID=A0A1H9R4F4_9LACT|nr:hypothetical protein [Isobaculum melis]SER67604.1 hypothetical protein SAMN04488559_10351 [Isobaculum melis]